MKNNSVMKMIMRKIYSAIQYRKKANDNDILMAKMNEEILMKMKMKSKKIMAKMKNQYQYQWYNNIIMAIVKCSAKIMKA